MNVSKIQKQARKGFRPLSAIGIFRRNLLEELFGRKFLVGISWEKFFGMMFLERILWEEFLHCYYLNMEGIDLFVKILVFVKILSQCAMKVGKISILRSARGKKIALKYSILKIRYIVSKTYISDFEVFTTFGIHKYFCALEL